MSKVKICCCFILLIVFTFNTSFAHRGRTDSSGGHYDYSAGEYHYHHGYSAHQHINGLCPFETDLEDLLPSKCQSCNSIVNPENGTNCFECGYELLDLSSIGIHTFVDGDPNKTRSEYFEEVQNLSNKVNDLEQQLDKHNYNVEEYGYNSIEEMSEKIDSLDTQIRNMWSGIFWIGLIAICITYYIGFNRGSNK